MNPHFFCSGTTAFLKIKDTQQHRNTATQQHRNTATQQHRNTATQQHTHTHTHTIAARTHESDSMPPSHPPKATGPWQNTSAAVCYAEPGGTWRLFLNFSNRPRRNGGKVAGPRFATKEEAQAGMEAFTTSWEQSMRGKPLKPTDTHPVPSSTSAAAATALPAGK